MRSALDPVAWGIQAGFEDARGRWRDTPPATTEWLLGAMHADGDPPEGPCLFSSPGRTPDLSEAISLVTEEGAELPLSGALPPDLPWGYHRVLVANGGERVLIHSPGRCYLPSHLRVWGWGIQLHSLWSERSWGIGDLGDLERFGRIARDQGAEVALLNPLHSPTPGPQATSPYFPSSRCLCNPLYLDVEQVAREMRSDVSLDDLASKARALLVDPHIDRDAVYELKMQALRAVHDGWPGDARFDEYVQNRGGVFDKLCTYMAIASAHGGGHRDWRADLRHPDSPAVTTWRSENPNEVRFQMWMQWCLDEQLCRSGKGIGLIQDVSVGVDPWGADAWLWQDVFADDVTVGAPPDVFSPTGQQWGLPPFDPWKLRASGYEAFISLLRACLTHGAGARIDHVMGLFRLWWIPEGSPATDGAYVTYPSEDLLDIIALESHRAHAFVIGEDLGTVEPHVRTEMARREMLSFKLAYFEDAPPDDYPERSLASITNHDLPTIAGLWSGSDLAELKDLGLEPSDEDWSEVRARIATLAGCDDDAGSAQVIEGAYRALARAPSRVLIAPLEDALGEETRVNVPGTTDEQRANWSLRLGADLDALTDRTAALAAALSRPPVVES